MEGSAKDAARSKWRLSQRHKRGKGGRFEGAGRSGRHRVAGATQDLGSNEDRYLDSEEEGMAGGEHAGPVRKSLGADLAELLENADAYDMGFYHRSRANLLEEYGLPPGEAASYQGLSFDLKGLAACLALLPRSEVLGTDAFDDEEGEEEMVASQQPLQAPVKPTQQAQQPAQAAWQQQQAPQATAAGQQYSRVEHPVSLSAGPGTAAAAAAVSSTSVGSQPQQPASLGYAPAARVAAEQGAAVPRASAVGATAAAAAGEAKSGYAPPLQQPLQEQPPQQPPLQQQRHSILGTPAAALAQQPAKAPAAAAAEPDDDLDFLLGLMDIPPTQHAQPSSSSSSPPHAQQSSNNSNWPLAQQAQQPNSSSRPLAAAHVVPMQQQVPLQAAAGAGPLSAGRGVSQISAPQPKEQSLDEWLDAL